ncbi:MAG: YfiR family protein [Bacteroidia bacterium]|nr:YfiR family protein [Bacteroidia bacterium]
MKKAFALVVLSFLLVSADLVKLAPPLASDTNTKIKAVFLYNFTKYIEWPQKYKSGNFIIGVLADEGFAKEIDVFFNPKSIGSQRFEIKYFPKPSDISQCHMIYVSPNFSGNISEVLNRIKGKSTLLITEKAGYAKQGAAINFTVVENKQKFELNKANAEKYDLKVSSSLTNLAINIE